MNGIVEAIDSAGRAFAQFALPMLIQSSVLIALLLLVDLALKRKVRAVFRYWIWLLVLPPSLGSPVSFGTWFGRSLEVPATALQESIEPQREPVSLPTALPRALSMTPPRVLSPGWQDFAGESTSTPARAVTPVSLEPSESTPAVEATPAEPVPSLSWQGLTLVVWAIVAFALLLLLIQRALFVKGLVAQADPSPRPLQEALDECRTRMGVRGTSAMRISANATSPAVCGLIRPTILIPRNLLGQLTSRDLEAVLLHELAHVKRGDLWINLLQTLLQVVYFYNPLLWLANAMIRRVREKAVDEAVLVAMGESAEQYPETLLNIAKLAFRRRPALSLRLIGVVESKSALRSRIKHMLTHPIPKTARLGVLGLLVVIVLAVVLLPMARAQGEESLSRLAILPNCGVWMADVAGESRRAGMPVLDLASERIIELPAVETENDLLSVTANNGRGDILYYYRRETKAAMITFLRSAGLHGEPASNEHEAITITPMQMPFETTVTTLGGSQYEIKITRADEEACSIRFRPLREESSTFKAILPDNMTVEVVGVCDYANEGKWWAPDGRVLREVPCTRHPNDQMSSWENVGTYQIAFRFERTEGLDLEWHVPGTQGLMVNDPHDPQTGARLGRMRLAFVRLPADQRTATVAIDIAVRADVGSRPGWQPRRAGVQFDNISLRSSRLTDVRVDAMSHDVEKSRADMRERMPLAKLVAHAYYEADAPIRISIPAFNGGGWGPQLDEIYHDDALNPMFFLVDGRAYGSRLGFAPFDGWGRTLHLPGELYIDAADFHLAPGKHTVAYGWKDLNVVDPGDPDAPVYFDRLVTDPVEFEVVEELPPDYYRPVYEEGWEDVLRRSIETPFTDEIREGVAGALLSIKLTAENLPFDTAFAVYLQAEGSAEEYPAGDLARQAGRQNFRMGCDHDVDELNWNTVEDTRWRIILQPSVEVAKKHPPIRHFYGREFVTDWVSFKRSPRFEQHRAAFEQRKNEPTHYGGTIKADKPVDLDRLNRRWDGQGQAWPLPDGFELGWSTDDGGTLRLDPDSGVRLLWLPEANARLVRVQSETRARLAELANSRTAQIIPPEGEPTLMAVLSSEGKVFFVTVSKVNETWANLSWYEADLLLGKVVDSQGEPIAGATLDFHGWDAVEKKSLSLDHVTTDADGCFAIPPVAPGEHISLTMVAAGFAPCDFVDLGRREDGSYWPDGLTFTLQRTGAIEGTVLGPDGEPLAKAPLSLTTTRTDGGGVTANDLRAITDESGRFRIDNVPPGIHMLYYPWSGPLASEVDSGKWQAFGQPGERWPSAPVKEVFGAATVDLDEGEEVTDVSIDLSKSTCAVEGRVRDTAGRLAAGAEVDFYWKLTNGALAAWGPLEGEGYSSSVTDPNGRYRLDNLPPGDWHIAARYDKQKTELRPVTLRQGRTTNQDLTLPGRIEGPAASGASASSATGAFGPWFILCRVAENQHTFSFGPFHALVMPPQRQDGRYVVRVQETPGELLDPNYGRRYVLKLKDSDALIDLAPHLDEVSHNQGELRPVEKLYVLDPDMQGRVEYVAAQYGLPSRTEATGAGPAAGHPAFIHWDPSNPPVPTLVGPYRGSTSDNSTIYFVAKHPQTLWQRDSSDARYHPNWSFRINGQDYPLRIIGHLALTRYPVTEGFSFPHDLADPPKEWPDGNYTLSVLIENTVWLDPQGRRHYCAELSAEPLAFAVQAGLFTSASGAPLPVEPPVSELVSHDAGSSATQDKSEKRRVYLRDCETPEANVVLDLATGQLLSAEPAASDEQYFQRLDKGDIAYEYAKNKSGLLCLRGARMQHLTEAGVEPLTPDVMRENFVVYVIDEVPAHYQVTTAEGDTYELTVRSVEPGDRGGALVEFARQSVSAPTDEDAGGGVLVGSGGQWGEAVEGIRCRLTPDQRVWTGGELPSFTVEVRNDGTSNRIVFGERPLMIEVDGEWFTEMAEGPGMEFPSAVEHSFCTLALDRQWWLRLDDETARDMLERRVGRTYDPSPPEELMLRPGTHVVRAAILTEDRTVGDSRIVLSNPVEFEVLPRRVYLSDLETPDANVVLDLATGQLLSAEPMRSDERYYQRVGKGDIIYEHAMNRSGLMCLRGATLQRRTEAGVAPLAPDHARDDITGYYVDDVPARYQVTTAEGGIYDLTVLSIDPGDNGGIRVEYARQGLSSPTDEDAGGGVLVGSGQEWGEAVEGVRCRLMAEKTVWASGEVPSFTVEARNDGTLRRYVISPVIGMVQIDEQWYHSLAGGAAVSLLPGGELEDLSIDLSGEWARIDTETSQQFLQPRRGRRGDTFGFSELPAALVLPPGKHVVRLGLLTYPPTVQDGPSFGVVSNPVEIEVVSVTGDTEIIGQQETRSGLELRIVPEQSRLAPEILEVCRDAVGVGPVADGRYVWRRVRAGTNVPPDAVIQEHAGRTWLLLCNDEPSIMVPGQGWSLTEASRSVDNRDRTAIAVEFDDAGAERLSRLTKSHIDESLAILIDGVVLAAPTIASQVTRWAVIGGTFTEQEVAGWIVALGFPAPEPLSPSEEIQRHGVSRGIMDPNGPLRDISGRVVDPNGLPVAGVQVAVCSARNCVDVTDGRLVPDNIIEKADDIVETDADGRFAFSNVLAESLVVACHETGIARIDSHDVTSDTTIVLEPWARVEGTLHIERKPAEDAEVAIAFGAQSRPFGYAWYRAQAQANANGEFAFSKVVPEWLTVEYATPADDSEDGVTHLRRIHVLPGETLKLALGDQGRSVVGRIVLPPDDGRPSDAAYWICMLETAEPGRHDPADSDSMSVSREHQESGTHKIDRYTESFYHDPNGQMLAFVPNEVGSFRVTDVTPGTYRLLAYLREPSAESTEGIGPYIATVEVPPMDSRGNEPLDIGVIAVTKDHVAQSENSAMEESGAAEGLEFLQGIPEFRGLRLDMTEDDLQRHIQQHSLAVRRYDEDGSTSYHLFAEDGENVIVMFRGAECSGIQRMRPDHQEAVGLYEEMRRDTNRSSQVETPPGLRIYDVNGVRIEAALVVYPRDSMDTNVIGRNLFWQNDANTKDCEIASDSLLTDPLLSDPNAGDFSTQGLVREENQGLSDPFVISALWSRCEQAQRQREVLPTVHVDAAPRTARRVATSAAPGVNPIGRYALSFDGIDDCLIVPPDQLLRFKPPFVIEIWAQADVPKSLRPVTRLNSDYWLSVMGFIRLGAEFHDRPQLQAFFDDEMVAEGIDVEKWPVVWPGTKPLPFIGLQSDGFMGWLRKASGSLMQVGPDGDIRQANVFRANQLMVDRPGWQHFYTWCYDANDYLPSDGPLVIGDSIIPGSVPFKGRIAEVRIWNRQLPTADTQSFGSTTVTGNEPNLIACWTFDEGDGQAVHDIGPHRLHAHLGKTGDVEDSDPTWVDLDPTAGLPFDPIVWQSGSIQALIDDALPGDVIQLPAGVFEERLVIDKPLAIIGTGWEQTTIQTRIDVPALLAEIRAMQQRAGETPNESAPSPITQEVLQSRLRPVVHVTGTAGVVIGGVKLSCLGTNTEGNSLALPVLRFDDAVGQVSDCAIVGSLGDGIHIGQRSNVEIENTLVAAAWGTGIVVDGLVDLPSHLRLHDCDIRNCYYAGVRIRAGTDARIERCRISGAAWHGIRYDDASPEISHNLIFGNARSGIYASGQTDATVMNNLFYANEMCGLSCWFQNSDFIGNNTFVQNERSGLEILGASHPAVRRNLFYANPIAIQGGSIRSDDPHANARDPIVPQECLLWMNGHDMRWWHDPNMAENAPSTQLANARRFDPQFVSAAAEDFSLQEDSPARAARIGVADPMTLESPWPLQPEEIAIIPEGDTRDYRQWKRP